MKRILGVLFLLVVVGALATQGYAWYQLRAGRTALEGYKTAEARGHLDACLRLWPGSERAHLLAARAARRAGDLDAARRHLEACETTEGKQSPDVVFEWALLKAVEGDLLEVEAFLNERARKDPAAAPLVWEALAEGDIRMYRTLAAMTVLDAWLEADPDNRRAHFLRGNAYRQGNAAKAVPDYRRVVELDPDDDQARWWLAFCLQEAGRFDEALPHLERLRDRGWPDRDLRPRLARSLDRIGKRDEARAVLDAALADDPHHGLALRTLGQLESAADNFPAAERALREAVRVQPADYQSRYALVQCLRQQGKDAEARQEEDQAEKVKARQERLGELRSREMSMRPHDPALHCEMGVLLDALGYTDVAEKWLYSALHEDPDYRPGHAALADFLERHQGDPARVAEYRRLAAGASAPDPDARPKKKP
ncbi:MAG TPA: tetratricopeptide repeat protein [Gemmataceae bacterium]|nr:tetratricopeptide repeat protein [Gemmataceae bacterium]